MKQILIIPNGGSPKLREKMEYAFAFSSGVPWYNRAKLGVQPHIFLQRMEIFQ